MKEVIGYHGTKEKNVEPIIKGGFAAPKSNPGDNHWLGHGIYFYSDYELAEWWAKTKVEAQNRRYGNEDKPAVIKGVIQADIIWDLDIPSTLDEFNDSRMKLEKRLVADGMTFDFSRGKGTKEERIRCFWMDLIKQEKNIEVMIYSFSKDNPSYSKFRIQNNINETNTLSSMGLSYRERQICVSNDRSIVSKEVVSPGFESFDEVIV